MKVSLNVLKGGVEKKVAGGRSENALSEVSKEYAGLRRPLFKKSILFKVWTLVDSGKEMTVNELATFYNISSSQVYTVLNKLWKRGYFLAPIKAEGNKAGIIRDVMQREEWFLQAMDRYVNNYYASSVERIARGLEGAFIELPSAKIQAARIENAMKRILLVANKQVNKRSR